MVQRFCGSLVGEWLPQVDMPMTFQSHLHLRILVTIHLANGESEILRNLHVDEGSHLTGPLEYV